MGVCTNEPTQTRTVRVRFGTTHIVEIDANPQVGDEHLVCEARQRVLDAGLADGPFRHGTVMR